MKIFQRNHSAIQNLLLSGLIGFFSAHLVAEEKEVKNSKIDIGSIFINPAEPYPNVFKPHDLPFKLPEDQIVRTEYRSKEFYAGILRSAEPCAIGEEERLSVQALFPDKKVFANRFECDDDIEENVTYTNTNKNYAFIAVYGADDLKLAKQFLDVVKETNRFPGANVRKMQVVMVVP